MKGLDEINKENKKADADKTKVKIELDNKIIVAQSYTDSALCITDGKQTVRFTTTVLRMMLKKHNPNGQNEWDINDILLQFLQDL